MIALQLLLGFAPWIAFLILSAGHTLFWLEAGLVVAALLTLLLGLLGIHRGTILWSGAAFFLLAIVAVRGYHNQWVITHMGILASGWLFATAAISLLTRRPFTEAYARQHAPRESWTTTGFRRSCYFTTSIWAAIFLVNTILNVIKVLWGDPNRWLQIAEYCVLLGGVLFTSLYAGLRSRVPQAKGNSI